MGRQPHIPNGLEYIMLIITTGREHGLQGFKILLLVIVRVYIGKHALQRGVFLALFVFIHILFCLFLCVVLFFVSLTQ